MGDLRIETQQFMVNSFFCRLNLQGCINLQLSVFVGAHLEIVTDRSQEGSQFCRGFGGIGGEACGHQLSPSLFVGGI